MVSFSISRYPNFELLVNMCIEIFEIGNSYLTSCSVYKYLLLKPPVAASMGIKYKCILRRYASCPKGHSTRKCISFTCAHAHILSIMAGAVTFQ